MLVYTYKKAKINYVELLGYYSIMIQCFTVLYIVAV